MSLWTMRGCASNAKAYNTSACNVIAVELISFSEQFVAALYTARSNMDQYFMSE